MFDFLNVPIGWLIRQCYKLVPNYAIALFILALIMKVLLFPFGIKQQKNMVRQAKLRPKEMAIRKRYAGREDKVTQQKMQQEVMKLYQDEGYNPASGCLPMILQLIIIFALYAVIQNPLTYVADFSKGEIKDLGVAVVQLYDEGKIDKSEFSSNALKQVEAQQKNINREDEEKAYENVKNPFSAQGMQVELVRIVRDNYTVFEYNNLFPEGKTEKDLPDFTIFNGKYDLSVNANINSLNWTILIPILTFVFTFGSMKITKKLTYQAPTQQQTADMGCSMKIMDYVMPLMSTFITLSVPAIIAVYWIYQNVLSTLQQLILKLMYPIPTFTEEEYKAVEREMNKGIKQPKKSQRKAKRAAHRIDLDDDDDAAPVAESTPKKKAKPSSLIAPAEMKDESDKNADNE